MLVKSSKNDIEGSALKREFMKTRILAYFAQWLFPRFSFVIFWCCCCCYCFNLCCFCIIFLWLFESKWGNVGSCKMDTSSQKKERHTSFTANMLAGEHISLICSTICLSPVFLLNKGYTLSIDSTIDLSQSQPLKMGHSRVVF